MTVITTKTDRQLHEAVIEELKWDSHVDETEVGVEVDEGIVTLTGTVDSYAKKIAALDAAHRVAGVLDVANDIQVKLPDGFARTDTEIARAIRDALDWDALIAEENIQSTVANGWVTLTGTVSWWPDLQYAERIVRNLRGVRGITNNLAVLAKPATENEIRTTIEDALNRRAEREADRIQVDVNGSTVTLRGRVHSWYEKRAILGAAGHAPGVRHIDDRLSVYPFG